MAVLRRFVITTEGSEPASFKIRSRPSAVDNSAAWIIAAVRLKGSKSITSAPLRRSLMALSTDVFSRAILVSCSSVFLLSWYEFLFCSEVVISFLEP